MPRQSLRDRATRHWQRTLNTREPLREIQRGILGNGAGTVRVPGRPDRVYVRVTAVGNALWEVLNDQVQDVLGLPVLIRKTLTGRDWEVIGVDKTMITNVGSGWQGRAYVPDHEHTNLNITVRNLTPLKSYPKNQSSLTVRVTPLYYTYAGELKFFPGGDIDLSSYQPATASQGVLVLTYLDPTTNLLGATVGQSAFFSPVLSLPKPPTPEFGYPSALVRTYYGQSYYREADFTDYRLILDKVMPIRGHTIYDEGVRVTPDRSILDFQGALITSYDDPTGQKTIVALSGAITGHDILGQGQAVTDRTVLDFQGPLVSTYDDPINTKTIVSSYYPDTMDGAALSFQIAGSEQASIDPSGFLFAKTHGARVRDSNPTTTIPHNTNTILSFDTEVNDDGDLFSGAASDRITIVQTGWYIISAGVRWQANTTGIREIRILIGGVFTLVRRNEAASTTGDLTQNIFTIIKLVASDIVQLRVLQTSGGDLDIDGGLAYSPYLSVARVG